MPRLAEDRPAGRLPAWSTSLPTFLLAAGLAGVFAFGLRGVPPEGRPEMLWPALGAAIAVALRASAARLAAVTAGLAVTALGVLVSGGWAVLPAAAFTLLLAAQLVGAAWLLRKWRMERMARPADVGMLAVAAGLATVATVLPALGLNEVFASAMGPHVTTVSWLVGPLWGVLTVAPVILTLRSPRRWPLRRAPEFVVAALLTGVSAYYTFAAVTPGRPGLLGWPYLVIVGLVWVAVRLGVAALAPVVSLLAWYGAIQSLTGQGAFAVGASDALGRLLVVQLFLVVIALTTLLVAVLTDERSRTLRALSDLVLLDAVTGLPNRRALHDRLSEALARLGRSPSVVGVLFCDLDQFKQVNDTLGHQIGDRLLAEVAHRIRSAAREGDTVARLGGDEFVVVCEGMRVPADAVRLAMRLQDSIRFPWTARHHTFRPTMSVGVATTSEPDVTIDELLRRADLAMYEAKDAGRDCVRSFDRAVAQGLEESVAMQQVLRTAVERHELVLHYQPIVDLVDNSVTGVEALVRMRAQDGQLVPPDRFIPLAESTGLISSIGAWVQRQAFIDLREHRARGVAQTVSINVSPVQLRRERFTDALLAEAARQNVDPSWVAVEVTETALVLDDALVSRTLAELHDAGVTIALDDFGTGYSSLSWLTQFPVDIVKIDRTFTAQLGVDPRRTAVTAAVIAVARELGLSVIAEGVETAEQRDRLVDLSCPMAQGYFFGRPLPADQVHGVGVA